MNTPGYNDNIVYLPINPDEEAFPTATGNITINSNIITNITDTSTIEINSYVEGINIPVSKVLSKTANSITIQNNCTATNINVDFTIYKIDFTYDTPNKYYDFETLIIAEPGLLPDGIDLTITLPPLLAFETQNFGDLQINHNPNIAYQTSNKTIVKVPTGYFLDGVQDGLVTADTSGDVITIFNPFFTRINNNGTYIVSIHKRYWDNKQDPISDPNDLYTGRLLKLGADKYYAVSQYSEDTISSIITRLNNGGGVGTGQIYYLNATDTTINSVTYKTLTAIPPNGALTTKNITVNNNTLLIEQFITVPLNKFSLSSGLWNFNIKAKADKVPTGDVIKIYAELWKYSADNTSILLFTANPNGNNLTLDYAELNLETTATAYSVLNTDRMLVKLYATTTHTQNIIVSIQYNSTTAISHVHTPFVEEISDYLLANANQDIILGLQETGATGVTVQIKGQQMTGADNQAPNIDITAPNSTGNKPSGVINFKTSVGGASGSTANTPVVMAKVTPQGIESKMFVTQKREITATSSTTTLTANDNGLIEILANSTNFQSIKLPNATLLTEGTTYTILNNSNGNTNIFNDASTVIYTLNASLYISIVLLDNSTANGTWDFIYPKQSDYLLTNANQDIILGTKETDSTGVDVVIKGTAKTGNDAIGNNINIYAPNGTGGGGSGDINFYSASGEASGVVLGAVSSTGASTNTNSLTISHTVPTGSNRYLVVQLSCGASAQANSVTYNGVAMTLINRTSSTSQKVESWGLVAPAQTTANIVITLSNTTSVVAKAINFTNVNQTTPTAKILTASNNNQVTSASILYNVVGTPTAVGDFVVSLLGTINQVATEGANQTNIWSGSSGAQERARASYEVASGSATVIDYTFGNSSFAMHSFVVNTLTGNSPNTFKKALSVIKDGVNTIGITIEPLEIVASASVTSLDFNSNSKIRITGATTHTIKLPNALKLIKGKEYRVINKTTTDVTIQDNTGNLLFTIKTNLDILFQLTDNSTIAGTWEQLNITPTSSVTESQYIRITPTSGVNTWDASRRMQFNQVVETLGSNITLSSTGIMRLGSAGTYELIAVWQGTAGGGGGVIRWYNETSGAFVGQQSIICPPDSTNPSTPNSVLYHTITITSPTNFSIRDTGGGNMQPVAVNSYVVARQLNIPTPTTANDVPTGTIIQNISPNIGGYLLCNGNSYNRSEYSALFNLLNTERGICTIAISTPAVITLTNHGLTTGQKVYFTTTGALPTGLSANTTYWVNVTGTNTFNLATSYANLITATYINTSGTQSGVHTVFLTIGNVSSATTFNVPDYQGKVLANASATHGIGKFTGAETHTLTINEMPSHNHWVQGYVFNDYDSNDVFSNRQGLDTGANQYNTNNVGGGQPHNNMQPTEFVYFHIKF